jgi:hypothetical protein
VKEGGGEFDGFDFVGVGVKGRYESAGKGVRRRRGKNRRGGVEMVTVRKDGVLVKVPAMSRGERRGKS